jgi:hypothetical protein
MLAKKPSARVRASNAHPSLIKVDKLFATMKELKLELVFYAGGILINDTERFQDTEWHIIDAINDEGIIELPCDMKNYKLVQDKELPPKEAPIAENIT